MMKAESLIRISVCINRKKGTTEEEFNEYWAHHHGPLVIPWLRRCGVVRYVQVRALHHLAFVRSWILLAWFWD